jgi:uncharacterized protein (TIGR02300 family)
MPEMGSKHECFSCGAKFYDLGKSEAICPKCGANQKDAKQNETGAEHAAARRRRREEILHADEPEVEVVPEVEGELAEVDLDEEEEAEDEADFEDEA